MTTATAGLCEVTSPYKLQHTVEALRWKIERMKHDLENKGCSSSSQQRCCESERKTALPTLRSSQPPPNDLVRIRESMQQELRQLVAEQRAATQWSVRAAKAEFAESKRDVVLDRKYDKNIRYCERRIKEQEYLNRAAASRAAIKEGHSRFSARMEVVSHQRCQSARQQRAQLHSVRAAEQQRARDELWRLEEEARRLSLALKEA